MIDFESLSAYNLSALKPETVDSIQKGTSG